MTSYSDAELVAAYLAGDGCAFATIVRKYQARLFRVARRYTFNHDDALDILQEALLRASKALARFRWECSLGTWLHRIVMNCGYDFVQKNKKRECIILDDDTNNHLRHTHLNHDPLHCYEDVLRIDGALNSLSPEHRDAIIQVDIVGHTIGSAALQQGVQPGTIKSRRARAKQHLKQLLREEALV